MDKKSRSPRYPGINLSEAIEKVKLVYEKEHTHKAGREVIARDLGYTGINGASASVISSIKQFGLLESVGDGMRVSDDATTIIELSPGEFEREEAIKRAAFTPKLFAEIYGEFGSKLPSDENLRLFLIKMGFNSKAANSAIRAYRETLGIVKDDLTEYTMETGTQGASPATDAVDRIKPTRPPDFKVDDTKVLGTNVLESGNYTEYLQYRISDECKVRVLFEGRVTQEAIKKLIAYLELGIDDFPSKNREE